MVISLRRRVFSLPTLLSFAVAIAFLFFLATQFDLDWEQMWANVRGMDPLEYLLATVLYYLSFLFRGLRWRILARNALINEMSEAKLPSAAHFSFMIIIAWFVNAVAWLRLGDAYRAYLLSREADSGFPWSLGTIFAERVLDMVTVFLLIVIGATAFSLAADFSGAEYIVGAAFAMSSVLGVVLVLMRRYGTRLASLLPHRLEAAYNRFHSGTLGSFRELRLPFVLSLIGWVFEVGRLYFVVQALDIQVGLPLVIVASLGHAILSTIPTPGGIGAVEPGVTGLLVLGMASHEAASATLVDRSITYGSVVVIGGLVFLLWNIGKSRRRKGVVGVRALGN